MKTKANISKRIIATIIDYGIYFLFVFAYIMTVGHPNNEGGYTVNGLPALLLPFVWLLYFVVLESLLQGTPGHLANGLKIYTIKRNNIDFTHSLKRHLLDPIDIFFFGIPALITIQNSDKNQRIGDMWAKTIVVDTTDTEQFVRFKF